MLRFLVQMQQENFQIILATGSIRTAVMVTQKHGNHLQIMPRIQDIAVKNVYEGAITQIPGH